MVGVIKGAAGAGGTGGTGGCGTGGCGTGTNTGGGIVTGGRAGGGRGRGGGATQPESASATAPNERGKLWRIEDIRIDMWILMLEAGVALFLLVFIVWWTMYADKRPDHQERALRAPEDKKIASQKDTPELPGE